LRASADSLLRTDVSNGNVAGAFSVADIFGAVAALKSVA